MAEEYRYQVDLVFTGKTQGELTAGKRPTIVFAPPPSYGGDEKTWTPEHLIVAALASCLSLTFRALAEKARLEVQIEHFPIEGVLTQAEDRRWSFTKFVARPQMMIAESDREKAATLLAKAEKYCLISQSLKGSVEIQPQFSFAST